MLLVRSNWMIFIEHFLSIIFRTISKKEECSNALPFENINEALRLGFGDYSCFDKATIDSLNAGHHLLFLTDGTNPWIFKHHAGIALLKFVDQCFSSIFVYQMIICLQGISNTSPCHCTSSVSSVRVCESNQKISMQFNGKQGCQRVVVPCDSSMLID